jgi:hypothetical protein
VAKAGEKYPGVSPPSTNRPARPPGFTHGSKISGAPPVRLTRVPVKGPFLLLDFLRKYDETVSYHLYIVNRYLWVLVPHITRICL